MNHILSFFQDRDIWVPAFAGLCFLAAAFSMVRIQILKRRLRDSGEALRKKEEKLRLLLDHAEDGILIIQGLKFKYANKKVYELLGLENKAEISKNFSDYIHPEDLRIALDGYEKTMFSGDRETSFHVRLVKPGQGLLWVHIRSIPVVWGDEPANLAFIRDITIAEKMDKPVASGPEKIEKECGI